MYRAQIKPHHPERNLPQWTMCTPNKRNRIMYTMKQGTTGNNHFHPEHDDTYNLPPFFAITITLGTKSPTGKQYMCTSGQQLEEGTWQTQPQEYKTFSLSHVISNNKILTPGNINHRNKKHSHSYTPPTTAKVQTPGNNNPMSTKTSSSSIRILIA